MHQLIDSPPPQVATFTMSEQVFLSLLKKVSQGIPKDARLLSVRFDLLSGKLIGCFESSEVLPTEDGYPIPEYKILVKDN